MASDRDTWRTIRAIDASRRAGWAKYFDADEKIEELRQTIDELVASILHHNRIPSSDALVEKAKMLQKKAWE